MGYYDDMYQVERKKKRESGAVRLVMTSVTSAVIGGLVVLMMVPMLSKTGYVSMMEPTPANAMISNNNVQAVNAQPISVNVDTATVRAVEKVENSVVGVINIRRSANWMNQENVESGEGSGVIFEKKNGKAHIITNYHVIDGADKLEVALPNGDKVDAKILGADQLTDLAVLEIDGSKINTIAELGDSKALKVGEPAIAIGNPLGLKFSRTVTQGIISSTDRSMPIDVNNDNQTDWEMDVIQTDAAINPGNSGGALVNIYGQVIGINSMKIAQSGVEGLGFAIPINDVKKITAELIQHGKLDRAYIGVQPYDLANVPRYHWKETLNLPDNVKEGVVVMGDVAKFSPAGKAGLRQYDVIVQLDDQSIATGAQLRKYLTLNKQPGDSVQVTYYRDGFKKTATVKLERSPQ